MAVDRSDVVDAVGIDRQSGESVLTIADQLAWLEVDDHLQLLQAKLNRYLGFLQAGELEDNHPPSVGRAVRIDIIFKHSPPATALKFLQSAREVVESSGHSLSWRTHPA